MPQPFQLPAEAVARCALSIVIPCYNEEDNLTTFHRRVSDAAAGVVGTDYELVVSSPCGAGERRWQRSRAVSRSGSDESLAYGVPAGFLDSGSSFDGSLGGPEPFGPTCVVSP